MKENNQNNWGNLDCVKVKKHGQRSSRESMSAQPITK